MNEVIEAEVLEAENTELTLSEELPLLVTKEEITIAQMMKMAEMLANSTIVPVSYQRRPENCFVALDMANRMGISVMMVMQNLHVIQGKPSWSGQAIASLILSHPKFKDVEVNYVGQEGKDDWGCYITATNVKSGKIVKGGTVTIGTTKKEGWYQKTGSKWQTMPEQMLAYRAYTWFGRVYCPESMMGLQSIEEVIDISNVVEKPETLNPYEKVGE